MLAVSDTGCGMDAETQAQIFEPVFTTKQQGKGTGLGLSTVYGIIEQSGGRISVESELLQGTTFRIHLPQAETQQPGPAERGQLELAVGTETVLLVEDETVVRSLVHQVLKRSGYNVLEAQHGAEALRIVLQHPDPIHLFADRPGDAIDGRPRSCQATSRHAERDESTLHVGLHRRFCHPPGCAGAGY